MDFDTAKENIQPLKGGRRADLLETALVSEKEMLEQERRTYEESINNYSGLDPLNLWYEYICWIEQAYVKSGSESGLEQVVSKCLQEFEDDPRYRQDRRLIRLFIKYIDMQSNPQELYLHLYNRGIGTMVADLYIAWSYYYDAANDFKQTEAIFKKGIDAGAQPFDELSQAHQSFSISMSQRMLYDDEASKNQFKISMEEKRHALTSLKPQRKKFVGSTRTGNAIKDENPGKFPTDENQPASSSTQQHKVTVHQDESVDFPKFQPSTSIVRSIVDSAKKNENVHEPGPWNKAKLGGKNLFTKATKPDFAIMEDEGFQSPILCKNKLYERPVKYPQNFISRNKPQADWKIPMVIEEPLQPNSLPCYDKIFVYPSSNVEISLEEIRAYKWQQERNLALIPNDFYDAHLKNTFEKGFRHFIGFVDKSFPQSELNYQLYLEDNPGFQFPFKKMILNGHEVSQEELLAVKYSKGLIKILTNEDFEEQITNDDMDITLIGDRRQSIYPMSRKSFVPRKSIMRKSTFLPILDKIESNSFEDVEKQDSSHEKTGTKRKLELSENDDEQIAGKARFSHEIHPKIVEAPNEGFKFPPPPHTLVSEKKTTRIEIFEDENNDTCSTMQFNLFINARSVSTPVAKKTVPRLVPLQPAEPEQEPESELKAVENENVNVECSQNASMHHPMMKKLSTIMEVTETTNVTKSSGSTDHNETEFTKKHSKIGFNFDTDKDKTIQSPFKIFRIPEEPTVTTNLLPKFFDFKKINATGIQTENQSPSNEIVEMPQPLQPSLNITKNQVSALLEKTELEMPDLNKTEDQTLIPENSLQIPLLEKTAALQIPMLEKTEILDETTGIKMSLIDKTQHGFSLFEKSELNLPEPSEIQTRQIQIYEDEPTHQSIREPDSVILHASRKENLIPFGKESQIKRTISDEFLDLCVKSPDHQVVCEEKAKARDISDLLKFSSSKTNVDLESSFNKLVIQKSPKSATPTMKILEDDLNTERFNMHLAFDKNSTAFTFNALQNPPQVRVDNKETISHLDHSIELCEEELTRLGYNAYEEKVVSKENEKSKSRSSEAIFKIPELPISKPVEKEVVTEKAANFVIFEDDTLNEEEENDDDLSRSIYYTKDKAPKENRVNEEVNENEWEDEKMCSFYVTPDNRYVHKSDYDRNVSMELRSAIYKSDGNPFSNEIRNLVLEQCNFDRYLENSVSTCTLLKNIPKLRTGNNFECGNESYKVTKFLAKGSFGSIFTIRSVQTNEVLVAKQEKPANLWEYYIFSELFDRLNTKSINHMMPAYMRIHSAVIANNASVLISDFSPFGTIIDVCNKIKNATGRNVEEYIGMILAAQLLKIIDFLHSCKIIHADLKPDNILLMSKIEMGMKVPAIQLIDFGSAIDMCIYDKDDVFTSVVNTENFICCEMRENKPWTYQTDLFGLCGTVHVLLFGKYMEVEKKIGKWQITTKFPRYFRKHTWDIFFNTLLNIPDCQNMPNLQMLKQNLEEEISLREKYVNDKIIEFNNALMS